VAETVTLKTPPTAGEPLITPVAVLIARPDGRPVAPKLVGLCVAVIWYRKLWLQVPVAVSELVMTGGSIVKLAVTVWFPFTVTEVCAVPGAAILEPVQPEKT